MRLAGRKNEASGGGGGKLTRAADAVRGRAPCRRGCTSSRPKPGGDRHGDDTGPTLGTLPAGRRGGGGGDVTQAEGAVRGRAPCRRGIITSSPTRGGKRHGAGMGPVLGTLPAWRRGGSGGSGELISGGGRSAGTSAMPQRHHHQQPYKRRRQTWRWQGPRPREPPCRAKGRGRGQRRGDSGSRRSAVTSVVPQRRHHQQADTWRRQAWR